MWSRWRWRGSSAAVVTIPSSLGLCERCSRALEAVGVPVRRRHWDIKTDYEGLVAAGELSFDPQQQSSVEQLQRLQLKLAGYEPPPPPSFLGKVWHTYHGLHIICEPIDSYLSRGTNLYGEP